MDNELESPSREPAPITTFFDTCKSVDEFFVKHRLSRCELAFPSTGLVYKRRIPMASVEQIKNESIESILVRPMKFVLHYDPEIGLRRYVEQTLTKPMQIVGRGQRPAGFFYEINPRKEVKISRLVVSLKNLNTVVEELIAEANRFYFLYCYPYT